MTRGGRVLASLALICAGSAIGLLLAEGAGRLLYPEWRDFDSGRFMVQALVPGYGRTTLGRAGFDGHFAQNDGDFRVRVAINGFGLRNSEPTEKADGRVWFVGDSFTFGWGVERNRMFSTLAGKGLGVPGYNVASPGTNVCGYQALLARMPATARPEAVVIGLVLENDILEYDCRAAAKNAALPDPDAGGGMKRFLTGNSALYNLLAVSIKQAPLLRDAMVAIGIVNREHIYSRTVTEANMAPAVEKTVAEIVRIRDELARGAALAVLVIPSRFEIRDDDSFYRTLRLETVAALGRAGIAVADPVEALKRAGFSGSHFAHDGHWNGLGHAIAGKVVAQKLRQIVSPR